MVFFRQPRNGEQVSFLIKLKKWRSPFMKKFQGMNTFALHQAIEADAHLESIYQIIIQNPESVEYKDQNGRYPLHIAASKSEIGLSPQDYQDLVLLLIEAFPEALTEPDNTFNLPLHHACRSGNINMALIEAYAVGAPSTLSVENGCGETPLEVAITSDYSYDEEMIKIFSGMTGEYEEWRRHSYGELYRQVTRLLPRENSLEYW